MRFVRLRTLSACRHGSVAVEMAFLAWPTVLLILGTLQLVIAQYAQAQLSNALFDSATFPEASLTVPNAPAYKVAICNKISIMPPSTCTARLIVEMMKLDDAQTTSAPVTGTSFVAGLPGDAVLLRAQLPNLKILPFLMPDFPAKASVVFRR